MITEKKTKQQEQTKKINLTTGGILGLLYMLLTMLVIFILKMLTLLVSLALPILLFLLFWLGGRFLNIMKNPPKLFAPQNKIEKQVKMQPVKQTAHARALARQLQLNYNYEFEQTLSLALANARNEQLEFQLGEIRHALTQEILSLKKQLELLQEQLQLQKLIESNLKNKLIGSQKELTTALKLIQELATQSGLLNSFDSIINDLNHACQEISNIVGTGINTATTGVTNAIDDMKEWDWQTIGKNTLIVAGVAAGAVAIGALALMGVAALPTLTTAAGILWQMGKSIF